MFWACEINSRFCASDSAVATSFQYYTLGVVGDVGVVGAVWRLFISQTPEWRQFVIVNLSVTIVPLMCGVVWYGVVWRGVV